MGMFMKGKDVQIRDYYYYKSRKTEIVQKDYFNALFVRTDFARELDNMQLFIQLWQKKEPFMTVPVYYQKQTEGIRSIVMKNADEERAKIRQVNMGKVMLNIPHRYDMIFFKPDREKDSYISKKSQQEQHVNAETELNLHLYSS